VTLPCSPSEPPRRGRGRPRHGLDGVEIARLHKLEGWSFGQIAKQLQAPRSTVRKAYLSAKASGEFMSRAQNQQRPSWPRPEPLTPCSQTAGTKQSSPKRRSALIRIHVFGVGADQDGSGSMYCWLNTRGKKKHISQISRRNKLDAEWAGVVDALGHLRRGQPAQIITDSPLLVAQFEERLPISSHRAIRDRVRSRRLRSQRDLKVSVVWLPLSMNLAAKAAESVVTPLCVPSMTEVAAELRY
jgi:ribonuclease HI